MGEKSAALGTLQAVLPMATDTVPILAAVFRARSVSALTYEPAAMTNPFIA
jgi:hypothetical protein